MSGQNTRANRGLYRRRGSPNWWLRYSDVNGGIVRESSHATEEKLARAILAKKKTLVVEGQNFKKKKEPKTTFYELCNQYSKLVAENSRSKGLKNFISIWKERFGNMPVKNVTQQKIERFLVERMAEKNLSPATRNRHLAFLSSMFNKGKAWELIGDNPAAGIKPLRENGARTRFLNNDEIGLLLHAASDQFRPILLTALHTGMRRGEIISLQWSDVDMKNRKITVQNSKSGKKRTIDITDTLLDALRVLPSRFKKGYVFPSPKDPTKPCYDFKRQFRNTIKASQIENFRFHDLRHTFASHLVMSGVDIKSVQELLGHASLIMTMKYFHLAPDHRLRAIKTLDLAYQTDTTTDTVDNSGLERST